MKPSVTLKRAVKLIESPGTWGQDTHYENGKYCAMGALRDAAKNGQDYFRAREPLRLAFNGSSGSFYEIAATNDDPDTKHEDVLMAFYLAIEIAKDAERGSK